MRYVEPAQHFKERRSVHRSQRQPHIQPISAPLYVVTVIFNQNRYASRYRLFEGFEKHCIDSGAIPYTVEIALRDRHHEVTQHDNPHHIQLRTESELWFKENGGNVGLSWLPNDFEYVAFVDADFLFTRADWATETLHMLQHYDAVQMYSNLTYLTSDFQPHNQMKGFAYLHCQGEAVPKEYGHRGAVGGAWAFRRSALEKLGGLLDVCILGSGDWHMAFALAGRDDVHPEMKFDAIPQYVKAIQDWRERARDLRGNIGYVDSHAIHHWHGPLKNRGYSTRWRILTENHFDPYLDLARDWQGLLSLTKHKPKLRDDIRRYFRQRNEDSISQ
jgi:hypothetical protein